MALYLAVLGALLWVMTRRPKEPQSDSQEKTPPDPPSQPKVTEAIAEGRKAIERMFPTTQSVESGHTGKADYQDIDDLIADWSKPPGPGVKVGFMNLASHHPAEFLFWLSLPFFMVSVSGLWDLPHWLIWTSIGLFFGGLLGGMGPIPGKWITFWVTLGELRRRRAR
jgi:hypothetical protein